MADHQTTIALNIGSQRISMAVFEVSKNDELILKAYDSESILADPAMDVSRASQTRVAIADLVERLNVGNCKARYAISGQSVFTRFVKLPPIQDDNIEQLVTFEAQQHVPFPLSEVVWDYELIEGATEKEAVIVAIKADSLDEINASVNDAGLGTLEVDVAPMALYNAFRAAYGNPEDPILLIDIGAKTSNLIYIEGRRFFTRGIAIGGVSITTAIAKEYGVSFAEAEHQKVSNGMVALAGGHTAQLDESVAALAMVIRNALNRLPAEIARTTNYYRSQHGGSAPRRVVLAGGGANLPYALEFFHEKLNLPVEYFNPVKNVALAKGMDPEIIQRHGHLMGEIIGLGLRSVGKSLINIDLVPLVVEQTRAADRRKPFLIAAAVIFLVGLATWAAFENLAAANAEEETVTMQDQRSSLAPLKSDIDQLLKKEESLRQIATGYTNAEAAHVYWMDAALYESWTIPLSVVLVVPLGVLGVLLSTLLRGYSNDVYFQVGLITIIGLSAKNAILIIEFAKDLQAQGKSVVASALEAAHLRFRPIVMTSLAFTLGVLPLAIATGAGSASQRAIGTGVIGGILTGTALAVVFVPIFFVVVRTLFKDSTRQAALHATQAEHTGLRPHD